MFTCFRGAERKSEDRPVSDESVLIEDCYVTLKSGEMYETLIPPGFFMPSPGDVVSFCSAPRTAHLYF